MSKRDWWIVFVFWVVLIGPALKWVFGGKDSIVEPIISSVDWIQEKVDSGVIYVFGESGEDILTREFGQTFSEKFILNLKSFNIFKILNGEVTLSHEDLPIRPVISKYTIDFMGKKGSMVESLKLGCYWDYDLLSNLQVDVDESILHIVSNYREISYPDFSEHHVDITEIISSSSNYMNKDDILNKEVHSYVLVKNSNSTPLVWDKTVNKNIPFDVEVISFVEEKIRHTRYLEDESPDDMVIRLVDLDSETGYTRELYTKILLKGITSISKIYLVNLKSLTMVNGEWEIDLEGKLIVTESGFPLHMEYHLDGEIMKVDLVESRNQPIEDCLN